MKKQQGLTLIELMVSISILMLMLTLSVPLISRYMPNLKLDNSSRDLTSNLRLAQQLSITEQVTYYIEISTSTNAYAIYKTGSSSPIKNVTLPPELRFQTVSGFTGDRINFNAYGAVSEAGTVVLGGSQKNKTINIKPSGYVELQ